MAGDQNTQPCLIAGVCEMILMETFRETSPFAPASEIQFVGKIKYFIVLILEIKKKKQKACLITIIPVYCMFLGYD